MSSPGLSSCRVLEAWPFKENKPTDKRLLLIAVSGEIPTGPPA